MEISPVRCQECHLPFSTLPEPVRQDGSSLTTALQVVDSTDKTYTSKANAAHNSVAQSRRCPHTPCLYHPRCAPFPHHDNMRNLKMTLSCFLQHARIRHEAPSIMQFPPRRNARIELCTS